MGGIRTDYFEFIEVRGSVTAKDLADKFGITERTAATWLAKYSSRGYLQHTSSSRKGIRSSEYAKHSGDLGGSYSIGKKEWHELKGAKAIFNQGTQRDAGEDW